jgi:hypothetical protein
MEEPAWRRVLCWGSVILFLSLPPTILILRLVSDSYHLRWAESIESAKYVVPYFTSLTGLVFGLAGLNTWDRLNGKHPEKAKDVKPSG